MLSNPVRKRFFILLGILLCIIFIFSFSTINLFVIGSISVALLNLYFYLNREHMNQRRIIAYNLLIFFILFVLFLFPLASIQKGNNNNFDWSEKKVKIPTRMIPNKVYPSPPISQIKSSDQHQVNPLSGEYLDTIFEEAKALISSLNAPPDSKEECSKNFGLDSVSLYSESKENVCVPQSEEGSSIACWHRVRMVAKADGFWPISRFCKAKNTLIKMYAPFFVDSNDTGTKGALGSAKIGPNIMAANCEPAPSFNQVDKTGRNDQWGYTWEVAVGAMLNGMDTKFDSQECSHYVNHTVLWIHRWDATNMFHFMEDIVTAFEELVVSGTNPSEVEVAVFDHMITTNALFQIFTHLFGIPARAIRSHPFPPGTCFKNSILGSYSRTSLLTKFYVGLENQCDSSVLKAFSFYFRSALSMAAWGTREPPTPEKKKIIFISRKTDKFHGPVGRILQNEDEIVSLIRSKLGSDWELDTYRPELYNVTDQYKHVGNAHILFGVHGAGMTHMLMMLPHVHVIEVFMDDRGPNNFHFKNMARWLGLSYSNPSPNYFSHFGDANAIWKVISASIQSIDAS